MKTKHTSCLVVLATVFLTTWTQARPDNDNFANPIILPFASSFQSTFSSQNATSEPGEEMQSTFHGSIWFQWVAPATGIAIFEASGKYIDDRRMRPIIRVGQGSQVASLALVGVSTNVNELAKLRIPVLQGQTYRVQIENGGGYPPANVTLGLARIDPITLADFGVQPSPAVYFHVPPRANDNFADSYNLATPDAQGKPIYPSRFSATSSTVQASNEPGEDLFSSFAETVWFTWVAPSTGIATFEATGRYRNDDRFVPRIRVGQGNSLSGLPLAGISTDINGQARLRIPVAKGQVYRIQVEAGSSYPSQIVTLNLTGIAAITQPDFGVLPKAAYFYTQPGVNDSFSQATRLGARDAKGRMVYPARFSATASTYQASKEAGEEVQSSSNGTVWFFWVAPATGIAMFEATGRHIYDGPMVPTVRVGQGTAVGDLPLLGVSRGEGNLARLNIPVFQGELYRIQVEDRLSGYPGQTITLNLAGIAPITQADFGVQARVPYYHVRPLANDNFSSPFRIANRDPKTKQLVYPSRFSVTAPILQATVEAGETVNSSFNRTIWYLWVAPASGVATFEATARSTVGRAALPSIRVAQGRSVRSPGYLSATDTDLGNRARTVVRVQRGRAYRIQVECNTYSFAQTATLNLVGLR
jgi:hypothetical protein